MLAMFVAAHFMLQGFVDGLYLLRQKFMLIKSKQNQIHMVERINYLGREICNNFNGARGCISPKCRNFHVCLLCKGEHSKMSCSQAKNEGVALQKIGAINQRK